MAANAGAGKTYTLANRVARLLLNDAPPEKILCLTFTKAAAAEMQHRLFQQLGHWAMLPDDQLTGLIGDIGAKPDDLPKARRLFAKALETPGGLKVLTIHAFCQIVLSRFPVEAGVTPGFDVLDESSSRALIAEARQAVLERAGRGDPALAGAVARLATDVGEYRLSDLLQAALGNDRRKMDRFFQELNGAPFEEAVWQAHGVARNADPVSDFCAQMRRERDNLRSLRDWLMSGGKSDVQAGETLSRILAQDVAPDSFALFWDWLLKKDGGPRSKLASKGLGDARPDLFSYLAQLQARFCEAEDKRRAARAAGLAEAASDRNRRRTPGLCRRQDPSRGAGLRRPHRQDPGPAGRGAMPPNGCSSSWTTASTIS